MRKTKPVTIQGEGRDQGKVFQITEMPTTQAEKWGIRAASAIARTGFDIPTGAGWDAMVAVGFQAFLRADWADVEPLLDEMMACVEFMPDAKRPDVTRRLVETDTEEIATIVKLRDEVFELHAGFSIAVALSTLAAARTETTDEPMPNTPTSDETLEP